MRAVHLDDLYPGWDGLQASLPVLREQILDPLRAGAPGGYTSWDWIRDRPGARVQVPVREVVVIDGVGAVAAARTAYDLTVWVTAPRAVRAARVLARDGETMSPGWRRWTAQEDQLFGTDHHPQPPWVVDAVLETTPAGEAR